MPVVSHDYRQDPSPFPALKTEQGVFTTPPYSADIKGSWRFKDEVTAKESAVAIWEKFLIYKLVSGLFSRDALQPAQRELLASITS